MERSSESNEEVRAVSEVVQPVAKGEEMAKVLASPIRKKTSKLLLPVQFTEAELQAIGLQLAATHQRIGVLTVEKKESADQFKSKIDGATSEASRLATNRINGWESRYVDCEVTYDFDKGTKQTVRLDSGEVVGEEPMKDEEKQLAFAAFESQAEEDARRGTDLPACHARSPRHRAGGFLFLPQLPRFPFRSVANDRAREVRHGLCERMERADRAIVLPRDVRSNVSDADLIAGRGDVCFRSALHLLARLTDSSSA